MGWPFGRKPREEWRDKPRAPGVVVSGFAEVPSPRLLRLGEGAGGFFLEGEEGTALSSALLVLEPGDGAGPGDVLVWAGAARTALPRPAASPSSPLEEICRPLPRPTHHIRRDDLSGRGVSGITGLRLRHSAGGITVLRLGPPPGARWVFVGLSAIAVFAGKFTLVDGEESKIVPAGRIALVSDPTATLYVEAGNDSALGVALGGAAVVSALG
jgi:hypothetical protein